MRVLKRNGEHAYFDFKKIEKVIRFACSNEETVEKFMSEWQVQVKDGMTTKEIQQSLIQFAAEQINATTPQWDKVAAKLFLYDMVKEAGIHRGYKRYGYGNFYRMIVDLTDKGLYDSLILEHYTRLDIEELGSYIKPERDDLLTYVGINTLAKRYCVRGFNKEVYELPQEAFMGVAMKIATAEKQENRVRWAKQFYDVMSQLFMTEATPTMSNARKPNGQLSSCFIGMPEDSLESIMNANELFSQVSKHGGGMGMYIGKVRAMGSAIRGFKGASGGVIPWIRIMNDTAVACNQLNVRAGAISITLDIWHKDILEFLQLKTNNGDLRRKAPDIFPSVSIPDVFMRQAFERKTRVRDGKFYLMCPYEIRAVKGWSLEDFYDETEGLDGEFTKRYWECVDDPRIDKVEIEPREILNLFATSDGETGTPFMFFRDTVNRDNPNKHKGMIYSSNLCHEIAQNMSAQGAVTRSFKTLDDGTIVSVDERKVGDFVVCNLATINLGKVHTKELIVDVVPTIVRMLDDVISINSLPVQQAEITNDFYRAIGVGLGGYHHMLAINGIRWETQEHIDMADKVTEMIFREAIRASAEIGLEKGSYLYYEGSEWNTGNYFLRHGYVAKDEAGNIVAVEGKEDWLPVARLAMKAMRNGYLMAPAPNGSSSHYGGYTQSIDPIFARVYLDEKKGQVIPVVAPDLDKVNPLLFYKTAHTIDQVWSIRAAAARQKHIDQSQSFNLYITPETKGEELFKYYALIWKLKVKTKYYTRNQSADEAAACESCSA